MSFDLFYSALVVSTVLLGLCLLLILSLLVMNIQDKIEARKNKK